MSRSDGLDQAIFGNNRGVGLTDSSSPTQNERWDFRLDGYVRLTSFGSKPPPDRALSYLRLADNEVAVLYRFQDPHGSPGRSPARALIGDPGVLTVPIALGLAEAWPKLPSDEADGTLLQVDTASVTALGGKQHDALRRRAVQERTILVKVLAAMIADPSKDLAVLECPQSATGAVMWGLHAIGDPYLREVHGLNRDWTFSTYETDYPAGSDRVPAIVFLPGRPSGSTTKRSVASLRSDASAGTKATETAQRLVDLFCQEKDVDYLQFEAPTTYEDETDVMYRRRPREVATSGQQQNEMAGAGSRTGAGGGPGGLASPVPPPDAPVRQPALRGPVDGPSTFSPAANGSHGGTTDILPTPSPPRDPSPAVAHVVAARGSAGVMAELDRLVTDHPDQDRRRRLRGELQASGGVDEVLGAIALKAGDQGTRARTRLLVALFGPDHEDLDGPSGQQCARTLVATSPSDDFVDLLLAAVARRSGGYSSVGGAVAQRHLAQRGLPVSEPPSLTDPLRSGPERHRGAAAEPPYRNIFVMAAVGIGAVLVLVLGFFLGSWTTADAAPATPTGQASPPSGAATAPGEDTPVYLAPKEEVVIVAKPQGDPNGTYVKASNCTELGESRWTCPFTPLSSVLHLKAADAEKPITPEQRASAEIATFS